MAGATVDVGTGITAAFGTSNWTMELTGISWSGISREAIETTHLGVSAPSSGQFGNRTFMPGDLSDPGELVLEGHFDTEQAVATKQPPIDKAIETLTLTWPKTGGTNAAKWECSAFNISCDVAGELDGKIIFRTTWKCSGNVTVTAAT